MSRLPGRLFLSTVLVILLASVALAETWIQAGWLYDGQSADLTGPAVSYGALVR